MKLCKFKCLFFSSVSIPASHMLIFATSFLPICARTFQNRSSESICINYVSSLNGALPLSVILKDNKRRQTKFSYENVFPLTQYCTFIRSIKIIICLKMLCRSNHYLSSRFSANLNFLIVLHVHTQSTRMINLCDYKKNKIIDLFALTESKCLQQLWFFKRRWLQWNAIAEKFMGNLQPFPSLLR